MNFDVFDIEKIDSLDLSQYYYSEISNFYKDLELFYNDAIKYIEDAKNNLSVSINDSSNLRTKMLKVMEKFKKDNDIPKKHKILSEKIVIIKNV